MTGSCQRALTATINKCDMSEGRKGHIYFLLTFKNRFYNKSYNKESRGFITRLLYTKLLSFARGTMNLSHKDCLIADLR